MDQFYKFPSEKNFLSLLKKSIKISLSKLIWFNILWAFKKSYYFINRLTMVLDPYAKFREEKTKRRLHFILFVLFEVNLRERPQSISESTPYQI